jgi:hypothetical protein
MFDEMKKPLGKFSLCIHPEGSHAWLDPGGEPLVSSSLTFFLGVQVTDK